MNFATPNSKAGRAIESAAKTESKPHSPATWYTVHRLFFTDTPYPWEIVRHDKCPGQLVRLTIIERFPTEQLADTEAGRLQRIAAMMERETTHKRRRDEQ